MFYLLVILLYCFNVSCKINYFNELNIERIEISFIMQQCIISFETCIQFNYEIFM